MNAPAEPISIGDVSFGELMSLERHGADTFIGLAPRYPWGRLFGGQVVAQALQAAQQTVADDYAVHSLHAYFIRGGTHREPVRYEVDRIRNGRSFTTRRVVARQSSGAILNLSASFQVAEEEADVQSMQAPADVPPPETLSEVGWGGLLSRRAVVQEFAHAISWVKLDGIPSGVPSLDAASLAFASDAVPTGAVRASHPIQVPRDEIHRTFIGASLDHVVYFHRPAHAHQWLLADVRCHGLVGGRGVSVGDLFTSDGVHVVTVVQEVLLRKRRPEVSDGDALSVSGGDALSVSDGDALSVSGGDALSVSGGDALSVSGGDALSVSGGDALSVSDGDALAGGKDV